MANPGRLVTLTLLMWPPVVELLMCFQTYEFYIYLSLISLLRSLGKEEVYTYRSAEKKDPFLRERKIHSYKHGYSTVYLGFV